ncbi:hypothetical protein L7F22_022434 [Adiantum nelumboides]|nr:hypothetical protein [Adiantum nelumboides]
MDTEAGPQVAMQEGFGYGSHRFFQHHSAAGNGYGSVFGSKPGGLTARLHSNIEEITPQDFNESAQWRGFSSYCFQNGSHGPKTTQIFDVDRANYTTASDLRLDMADGTVAADLCLKEKRRKQSVFTNSSSIHQVSATRGESSVEEDPGSLSLKLSFASAEDATGTRNAKRLRPLSPGNQSPVCQVDDCHTDLKHAKDYHRRHKVCESHSKAPQSLVQNVMQRFCQQCSRFHPLPEFDEGKRSCRRRLAGHNKRRRKTEVTTNGTPLSDVVKGTDHLLSLVALLSQLQAVKAKEKPDGHGTEYDSILQCLRKAAPVSSLPGASTVGLPQGLQSLRVPPQSIQESQRGASNLLEGLSKDALVVFLRNAFQAQVTAPQGRTQLPKDPLHDWNAQALYSHAGSSPEDHSRNGLVMDNVPYEVAGKLKSSSDSDPAELCSRPGVTKQYLGHTDSLSFEEEDPDSPPNSTSTRPLEEQNFFPMERGAGARSGAADLGDKTTRCSGLDYQEEDLNLSPSSLQPACAAGGDKQPSDSSEYGSDHSPSSSSSNVQESKKNGRLIFKLCDPKHVATMTRTHESEIQQWLSLSPCSLEGYLRPGCILLTVFLSMPQRTWEELVTNLRGSLKRLVRLAESDLWTKGRIIVQVGHQRALIMNGKVKKIRFPRTLKAPLLRSVRPLAVVAGQEATLSVCGDNFVPETRIVCVYRGRYVLHEVSASGSKAAGCDPCLSTSRTSEEVQEIHFPGGPPNVLGRCFIEVEHSFMGNALPVIVANKEICSELQSLEVDLSSDVGWETEKSAEDSSDESRVGKEVEALNFLHELGWIFQSTSEFSSTNGDPIPQIGLSRFKGVLKYAVLRDWCAIVKQLLDLLFFFGIKDNAEVLQVLSEVNLVHQAVKRKCRPMVDLLLHYIFIGDGSRQCNIFTPVAESPGGFSPLHVAASMLDAEEIIDALTEDPNEAGLHGWTSACDHLGRTPEWHARNRGNLSYVELVERKLSKKLSHSVRITILDASESSAGANRDPSNESASRVECTAALEISAFPRRATSSSAQVCRDCRAAARLHPFRSARPQSRMYRPLMMMMVAVATVCATVALLSKTAPMLDCVLYSLKWEGIMYGPV